MRGNFFTVDELVCSYFNRQEYSIFYSAAFVHTFDRALILFFACEFKRRENKQKTVAGVFVVDPCASLHHSVQTYLPLPDMTHCSVMNDFVRIHCSLLTSEAFISLICGISLRWPTLIVGGLDKRISIFIGGYRLFAKGRMKKVVIIFI